jgi:hypothetical protein
MPCPFPSSHRPTYDSAQPKKRNCNQNNDCPMNGAAGGADVGIDDIDAPE